MVGGDFTTVGGEPRNRLARLNADGTADTAFNPDLNGSVLSLALQLDGKLLVGGYFTQVFGQTRNYMAQLNADGTLDTTFSSNANDIVTALALQSDGKVVVGGNFTTIGGQPRNYMARLSTTQAALQSLDIIAYTAGSSVISWARAGAGPELALPPQLLFSVAGTTYAPAGVMRRSSNGWRMTGVLPPLNNAFYLRAQGQISSGFGNESSGLIESTRQFFLRGNDGIFFDRFEP